MTEDISTNDEIIDIPSDWAYPKPFIQTIKLNDGTVMDGYAIKSSIADEIWVHPKDPDFTYTDIIQMFADSEKTSHIESEIMSDQRVEYDGYTRMTNVNYQMDGTFTICLTKPVS